MNNPLANYPQREANVSGLANVREQQLVNLFQTVFHNLRTHVGNIRVLSDMARGENQPDERDMALIHLGVATEDLEKTIDDMARIAFVCDGGEIERENLLLKDFIDRMEFLFNSHDQPAKVKIINRVPREVKVFCNRVYLESILLNLCANAIRYAHQDRFPEIIFGWSEVDQSKVLSVADNGLGIDLQRHSEALFGLYKTFHQRVDAGGLGLYITKYQVEAMGGRIDVESKVDHGTTFYIRFRDTGGASV